MTFNTTPRGSRVGRIPLRGAELVTGLLAAIVLLQACGAPEDDDPSRAEGEELLVIDGKVCGYFDKSLLAERFDNEPMYSSGGGIEQALDDVAPGGDQCRLKGVNFAGTFVDAYFSRPSEESFQPNAGTLAPGCESLPAREDWGTAQVCQMSNYVELDAASAERHIRIAVYLDVRNDPAWAESVAVDLLDNMRENVDTYLAEHPQ